MSIAFLLKIDELRYIAKLGNAAVLGITESKLDNCIFDSEIQIENYQMFRCDRNRKGGGVASYLINDLSYIKKDFFPEEIENMFFEILLPKTKPIHSFFTSMLYFLLSLSMLRKKSFSVSKYAKDMLAYRKRIPCCFMQ